jgi:AmpD protein
LTDVAGHEHIAPGRKTDPGPFFDWHDYRERYQRALAQVSSSIGAVRSLQFPAITKSQLHCSKKLSE